MKKKVIITFHAVPQQKEINYQFLRTFSYPENNLTLWSAKLVFSYLYRISNLFCDRIIVHSEYMKNVLIEDYFLPGKKIIPVPIGADTPYPSTTNVSLGHDVDSLIKNKKILLFFGFLLKRKGLEYLIDAFSTLSQTFPQYILVLAGGTLDYQNNYIIDLKKRVESLNLTHKIIFTGFLSEKQIHKLYASSQLLVLPYTYSISSSLPLTFAIQHHKPVIATSIGSLKEEIQDKIDGILCEPHNTKSLLHALESVVSNKKLYEMLVKGMKVTHRNRTWKKTGERTYKIYESLL